jgi:hypothetical protein
MRMQSPDLWNPVLVSFYPTAAAASIFINVATLRSACRQSGISSVQGLLSAASSGINLPQSPAAWVYSVFMLLYAATGAQHSYMASATYSYIVNSQPVTFRWLIQVPIYHHVLPRQSPNQPPATCNALQPEGCYFVYWNLAL